MYVFTFGGMKNLIKKANEDLLTPVQISRRLRDMGAVWDEGKEYPMFRYLYGALKRSEARIEKGEQKRPLTQRERQSIKNAGNPKMLA
jgi:hypothetical protein